MYAVAVRVVAPCQMVPTVLLIPFNADLHISLAVQRFLSVFFCILQLDLSGRSGVAIEVRVVALAPASSESSLAQCVLGLSIVFTRTLVHMQPDLCLCRWC